MQISTVHKRVGRGAGPVDETLSVTKPLRDIAYSA